MISIGCGETQNMIFLAQYMQEFREMHPAVQFHVYTAIADEIKERIEKGRLDMGLLLEPVDLGKYNYIRMPYKERWGALVWEGSPLQEKKRSRPGNFRSSPHHGASGVCQKRIGKLVWTLLRETGGSGDL